MATVAPDGPRTSPPTPRRLRPAAVRVAAVFGLAVLAISAPLVRILGDAPEFLIAHGLGPGPAARYLAVVVIGIPSVVALVTLVPGSVGRRIRSVVVWLLACLAVASLVQPLSGWFVPFWVATLGGGTALAIAERDRPAVRSACAMLATLALLLGAWLAGPSRVGRYLRAGDAPTVEAAPIDADLPVVVVVFDEISLASLLDSRATIDATRFPNLAALADTSHWFRVAASVSPQTSASVPALLSGVAPDPDRVPVGSEYPTNLFRLLERSHQSAAYEPITALCGRRCEPTSTPSTDGPDATTSADLATLIEDSAIVFGHAVGNDAVRDALPPIAHGWAGFGGRVDGDEIDEVRTGGGYGTFFAEAAQLQQLLQVEPHDDRPVLRVAHLIAPHLPWVAMPDGTVHSGGDPDGLVVAGGALTWTEGEAARRAGYQRYLLQLGALDREVGALRATLEDRDLWDEALVVVTADHGLQFEPGGLRSVAAGGVEVTSVPLFIKQPGQSEGVIDDRAALTIDIVPTILGVLGGSDRRLDGLDLFHDDIPRQRSDAFSALRDVRTTPDQRLDSLRALVERRSAWIDPDGGWEAVYQAGVARELVGRPLAELGPASPAGTWRRATGETGRRVTWTLDDTVDTSVVLLTCDGTVAGATPATGPSGSGYVSHRSCPDPDQVGLAHLDADGEVRTWDRAD